MFTENQLKAENYLWKFCKLHSSFQGKLLDIKQIQEGLIDRPGKFVNDVLKKVDIENQVKKQVQLYFSSQKEVHELLDAIEDVNQRLILRYKFIEFLNWKDITDKMQYSWDQIKRIYQKALDEVYLILLIKGKIRNDN